MSIMKYVVLVFLAMICTAFAVTVLEAENSADLTVEPSSNGCECEGYTCQCCEHMDIERLHLNETGCVDVSYLPDKLGLRLSMELNGLVLLNETVSIANPPPICFAVPHLEKLASMCIDMYKIDWHSKYGGCMKLQAKLAGFTLTSIDLGCFYFHPKIRLHSLGLASLLIDLDNKLDQKASKSAENDKILL